MSDGANYSGVTIVNPFRLGLFAGAPPLVARRVEVVRFQPAADGFLRRSSRVHRVLLGRRGLRAVGSVLKRKRRQTWRMDIRAGDVFQVNLAQRLLFPEQEAAPLLYLRQHLA
jgi:hypothetical protein